MPSETPAAHNRAERVLAYMVASAIGLSILAFLAVIIGTWLGAGADDGFSTGIWPVVIILPLIGLPLGILFLVALLITSAVNRSRAIQKD